MQKKLVIDVAHQLLSRHQKLPALESRDRASGYWDMRGNTSPASTHNYAFLYSVFFSRFFLFFFFINRN